MDLSCSRKPELFAGRDSVTNPLSGWHTNLILLQRRQCVLFVHGATRFPVFVPALKKADFAELDWFFQDGFMNALLKVGAEDKHMKAAEQWLAPLMCDNNCKTARCRACSIKWGRSSVTGSNTIMPE